LNYTLTYKLSYLDGGNTEKTEEHTENHSTKEEALNSAWNAYYFDGGCQLHSFQLNGEPLKLEEGD
jgi:hypothetical protein